MFSVIFASVSVLLTVLFVSSLANVILACSPRPKSI